MIHSIKQWANDYTHHFPTHLGKTILKSAAFSFTVSAIFTFDLKQSCWIGMIGGIVTLVNALTIPFFYKKLADQKGIMPLSRFVFTQFVSLGIVQIGIENLTSFRSNFFFSAFFHLTIQKTVRFITGSINDPKIIDVNHAQLFYYI